MPLASAPDPQVEIELSKCGSAVRLWVIQEAARRYGRQQSISLSLEQARALRTRLAERIADAEARTQETPR